MLRRIGTMLNVFMISLLGFSREYSVIGLGPRDARFHTLNWKNAHYSQDKCTNFASIISRMVNK